MKYRKKPIEIEAIAYNGHNGSELFRWSGGKVVESPVLEPSDDDPIGCYVQVYKPDGVMIGVTGDYIIRGIKGEFYPCKPDIFELTYEPINGD